MTVLPDVIRFVIFSTYGVGVGFMAMTNVIAYRVLRPPRRIGFLWWHVTAVSATVLCFGVVAVEGVIGRLGNPHIRWQSLVVLIGCLLFVTSQVIIFRVERQRLIEQLARRDLSGRP